MATIPFDEIVPGATAQLAMIDGLQYLSIRDVIMHFGNQTVKAANKTWERLSPDKKKEVETNCRHFQFPGQGKKPEPVITFQGAIKLVMWIGGENAKKYRSAMTSILTRYYAGDGSLVEEVEANAQSAAPVAQMARAALAAEAMPVQNEISLPNKRKLEELEIAKLEADIGSRRAETEARLAETEARRTETEARRHLVNHEHITKCTVSYQDMCKDTVMDERARLIFKDLYLNMAMLREQPVAAGGGQALLANGPSPNKPISLSLVAGELGLKIPSNELISIGVELKKRYVEKHGKSPPKHDQLCDGRVTKVNSYLESDRPLVEEVLRWHAAGRA